MCGTIIFCKYLLLLVAYRRNTIVVYRTLQTIKRNRHDNLVYFAKNASLFWDFKLF